MKNSSDPTDTTAVWFACKLPGIPAETCRAIANEYEQSGRFVGLNLGNSYGLSPDCSGVLQDIDALPVCN